MTALSFFASGTYQRKIGMEALSCMSQTMVCRSIHTVTNILSTHLIDRYVKFPETVDEVRDIKQRFFMESGYPEVVGLIDCTHVLLTAVPKDVEIGYVNHNGSHSINTQIICDYDMNIININARYPGSTHDAYIWRNSKVLVQLKRTHREDDHKWLIGDGGYPLQPWLMVPIRAPVNPQEQLFNDKHCKLRCRVELCIGRFKNRFRCLIENEQRYKPIRVALIINACAVLHNILMQNGLNGEEFDDEVIDEPVDDDGEFDELLNENQYLVQGRLSRNILVNYFAENNN